MIAAVILISIRISLWILIQYLFLLSLNCPFIFHFLLQNYSMNLNANGNAQRLLFSNGNWHIEVCSSSVYWPVVCSYRLMKLSQILQVKYNTNLSQYRWYRFGLMTEITWSLNRRNMVGHCGALVLFQCKKREKTLKLEWEGK